MLNRDYNVRFIGPLPVIACEEATNEFIGNMDIKVRDMEFMMVSPNFVHPEQSIMMAIVTYKPVM